MIERALQIAEGDVGIDGEPSIWWNMGEWLASGGSLRYTLPGMTMRSGGFCFSMVRICTGEVCVRSSRRSRCGFFSWSGDEDRVLRVARGMVRRKIQRLEVVVVGFDLRAFGNRVAEIAEDGDDLVHRADDGMLRAQRTANAGEGDVDAFGWRVWLGGRAGLEAFSVASTFASTSCS